MKRFLAMAALLVLCAGPVTADYLFIKIDLSKVNFSGEAQPQGGPGGEAQPDGGFGGFPGGGMKGGAFPPGFQPGGMQPGMQPGGLQPGGKQPGGKQPGGLQPGMNPGIGPMDEFGDQPEGEEYASELPPQYVLAYIEMRSVSKMLQSVDGSRLMEFDHRFGRKGRFPNVPIVEYRTVAKDSVGKEFNKKFGKVLTDASDANNLHHAASWALAHGLTKYFHDAMAGLAKIDPKHFAVGNYQRVQAELKKPLDTDDPTSQAVLSLFKEDFQVTVSKGGHYGILTKQGGPQAAAITARRADRFEEAFDNFFYWFALQEGVAQPAMPKYRLYAVLLDDRNSFHSTHALWGHPPMAADGFTPRRDNLIILSTRRLDENYTVFEKNVSSLWTQGISREELISGDIWKRAQAKQNVFGAAAYQTLAIVQRAMEDEGERASISHEATRQLLFATGVLPRLVNVPEWVQSGMASYFDTPHGALYPGVGLPSWTHLVSFRHFLKSNRLGTSHEMFLRTISNQFFLDALRTADEYKDQEEQAKSKQLKEELEMARATAWALVYFVMDRRKTSQLLQFTQELNQLPRDLELDERTLQACFGRAFNLIDAKDPRRLDPTKSRAFAAEWFDHMMQVELEVPQARQMFTDYRYPPAKRKAAAQSNQPGAAPGVIAPGAAPGAIPNIAPGLNPKAPMKKRG